MINGRHCGANSWSLLCAKAIYRVFISVALGAARTHCGSVNVWNDLDIAHSIPKMRRHESMPSFLRLVVNNGVTGMSRTVGGFCVLSVMHGLWVGIRVLDVWVGHPRSPAALSAVTRDQIPTDADRRADLYQSTQCPSCGSSILLDGYFHRQVPQTLPESPKETSQGKQTDGDEISW